ncbi:MAG TPA: hypothetical protein VG711_06030 [Phycisphaerales bacterium]|nr:hypothetical protein [Phycisphaerales bacterium]
MKSPFLRWLFDVKSIPTNGEPARLVWEHPWPAWVWALLFILLSLFAIWSYSRMTGSRAGRGLCAALRLCLILLLLLIISGPMLEVQRESVEQDWVLMLVDRSASISIQDVDDPTQPEAPRISRDEQLRAALDKNAGLLDQLARNRHLVWLGFSYGAFNLQSSAQSRPAATEPAESPTERLAMGEPAGPRTSINTAIEQALQQAAARPIAAVVVFSDGQTDDPPSRALVRRLQSDAIPVYTIPLGSDEPIGDLAVGRIDAPRRAFIKDRVPVNVQIDRLGAANSSSGATVKLIDTGTGQTLAEEKIKPGDERDHVTLTAEPSVAGQATWEVRIDSDVKDLIASNNLKPFSIELVDRPLRVLYVDGYPRWEYRYLKNLLIREKSVKSSVMLLSADRDFAQEGNDPIARLPRSPGELADFDVIILGDIPANYLSPDQLEMIRDHIAQRGAGLLWIGGERSTPHTFADTPLADLLPMRGELDLQPLSQPVTMSPTPLAERIGVLRLVSQGQAGWPAELSDSSTGWSQLYYVQRIEPGQLKPTTEVLAQTTNMVNGENFPIVLSMRYGAGECLYVATDEIWRWRYGRGEFYPDQFWIQMVRMLGRESLSKTGDPASLEVDPRRIPIGQSVQVNLEIIDDSLIQARREAVTAMVTDESGSELAELNLLPQSGSESRFTATYLPQSVGNLTVKITDPLLSKQTASAALEVFAPDDELRRPQTDHNLLASLSAATGGKVLSPSELDQLSTIRNRAVKTRNPITERIWDTPFVFAIVLALFAMEWVSRRLLRLA